AGPPDLLVTDGGAWIMHPDGDDLAAVPLGLDQAQHRFKVVPGPLFLTKELMNEHDIGPGDDTFMIGRFISHEGKQQNTPSVRFGNIAMMPDEPLRHQYGFDQESFLVEARSIGGYSGSPVFVYAPPFAARPKSDGISSGMLGPWLLGVDWCHLPYTAKVRDPNNDGKPVPEDWYVEANTGMMGVIPAWKLEELMSDSEFVKQRQEIDTQIAKDRHVAQQVVLDSAERPFSREDFLRDLRKVSRRQTPPESAPEADGR
ncbi:MAG: hypothetical protein KGJ86_10040, partial [Chloroflexota bacterium]|nr:hypothetical protein [Chloroflexota bacterium]